MTEFFSSIQKWFSEKTSSPLYFTYIGFFIVWNWKFFQIIFLESETLFTSPRVEYLAKLDLHIFDFIPFNWTVNLIWHIGPPAFLTYLTIMYLPILQKWALDKYLDNRFERKRIFDIKQLRHNNWILEQEKGDKKTLENIKYVREQKAKVEKEIKKTMTEKERWEFEYPEFEKSPYFYEFKKILEVIYKKSGYIDDGKGPYAPAIALATADSWGLISYNGASRNKIELTEKGKIFAKIFLKQYPI